MMPPEISGYLYQDPPTKLLPQYSSDQWSVDLTSGETTRLYFQHLYKVLFKLLLKTQSSVAKDSEKQLHPLEVVDIADGYEIAFKSKYHHWECILGQGTIRISKSQVKSSKLRNTGRDFSKQRSESFNYKLLLSDQQRKGYIQKPEEMTDLQDQWKAFKGKSRLSTSSRLNDWQLSGSWMRQRKVGQTGMKINFQKCFGYQSDLKFQNHRQDSGRAWLQTMSLWRNGNAPLQMVTIPSLK